MHFQMFPKVTPINLFKILNSRRYEEDIYWRRMEEEQMYWGEQRRRMAPPPLMSRPGMPVPPLLVSVITEFHQRYKGHSEIKILEILYFTTRWPWLHLLARKSILEFHGGKGSSQDNQSPCVHFKIINQ